MAKEYQFNTIAFADNRDQWFEAIREASDPLLYSRKANTKREPIKSADFLPPSVNTDNQQPTNTRLYALKRKMELEQYRSAQPVTESERRSKLLRSLIGE